MTPKTAVSEGLDRVIHERARLSIVAALSSADELSYLELRGITELTDGNLSVHLRVLEAAGYVAVRKSLEGRKARTTVRLTGAGRRAFRAYLEALRRIIGKFRP